MAANAIDAAGSERYNKNQNDKRQPVPGCPIEGIECKAKIRRKCGEQKI
ncbi:hypothetical protein HMP0721_2370 [Pseudoramibacter alactolyticus ATCC 23263]|jgi:hypothetical protein|uniref:Uncharacterized protein n=1 Tax=Pseudoramibacter alactolyticus ATCC 23263 TaxID=887929 RepID=E6MK34_9FIRM|nr:hypothetical protein HMP0721_2370 [Pseudoramibacter alactolyticus ATCC 23263]